MIRRFNRYELKYLLQVDHAEIIKRDLLERMRPDKFGGTRGYRILSLYYDSPDYECFWAKIEGLRFRRKVRLRLYPGEDITKVETGLVEIKQRIDRTVQKRRLVLPLPQAETLCIGEAIPEGLDSMDRQVANEVLYMARALHLQPAAVTAYHRVAFEDNDASAGLRVTFDTDLRSRVHDLVVNSPAENHRFASPDWCIMEVKANESVPDWITSLLARHNCQLRRVSKYCAGLATLKNLDVMPLAIGPGTLPQTQE